MHLYPAIDLQNGCCVRLRQGAFDSATLYEKDPLQQAQRFKNAGARFLHLVDLDGAKMGSAQQTDLIVRLIKESGLQVQIGGGLRRTEDIARLLDAGAHRVVIGSLAIEEKEQTLSWIKQFGGSKITLAFDVQLQDHKDPEVLTQGWTKESDQSLYDLLDPFLDAGLETVLCTDVGRDGLLTGPNFELYDTLQKRWPSVLLIASGGIAALEDLRKLKKNGLYGAILGKALYEEKIDLATALKESDYAG